MQAVIGCDGVLSVFHGGTASPRHSSRHSLPFGKSSVSVFCAGDECISQLGRWRWSVCLQHSRRPELSVFSNGRVIYNKNEEEEEEEEEVGGSNDNLQIVEMASTFDDFFPEENMAIFAACLVGLLTGIGVVLFNIAVHEIRDFFWDGIPYRGASWLREEPIEITWQRVILVPTCGGLFVSLLNMIRTSVEVSNTGVSVSRLKSAAEPILKAVAACVTLGTGNSLGPEGPSVEIGASIAKGVGTFLDKSSQRKLSLRAAGSAAGISSGFNAAVAGCFFAVESVLWPSTEESRLSLTNTTSMVILSAVIASVVSEIGLGSEPAFIVPYFDFRSPTELPLYLLLGIVCGLVSLALSRSTTFMLATVDNISKRSGIPKSLFPIFGGLTVGLISLAYPEILYWGFQNVDILLESRPSKVLSADLLLQILGVKIFATSFCRASGLVGGYYAPSLFIGAATGMAYGKVLSFVVSQYAPFFPFPFLEVAAPQAYGLVGMAATLAGVCQVPLTAVLLLFELTQDYRIVLPLLGAVGLSSLMTSGQTRRKGVMSTNIRKVGNANSIKHQKTIASSEAEKNLNNGVLCDLESSLCLSEDDDDTTIDIARRILVSQAMRTHYLTVRMNTSVVETISLMLAEKHSCALVVDDHGFLIGLLTLADIQQFSTLPRAKSYSPEDLTVSEVCGPDGEDCQVLWMIASNASLLSAKILMNRHGINQLPVILEHLEDQRGYPVGILDNECITLTCRSLAIREFLQQFSSPGRPEN